MGDDPADRLYRGLDRRHSAAPNIQIIEKSAIELLRNALANPRYGAALIFIPLNRLKFVNAIGGTCFRSTSNSFLRNRRFVFGVTIVRGLIVIFCMAPT